MFHFSKKAYREITRRTSVIPPRYWVIIVVALLLGLRVIGNSHSRPAQLDDIAAEIGSSNYMVKDEGILKNAKLRVSHQGNRILYCMSSESGVGVFVCDVESGQRRMVFEEKEICFGTGPHGVLKVYPWSPDDRRFVFGHQGPGAINGDYDRPNETVLTVFNMETGQEERTFEIPFGQVAAVDWLTPDAFVSASGTNGQDFYLMEKKADGRWEQKRLEKPLVGENAEMNRFGALAAISDDTIAWLQGPNIWMMNVVSNKVWKLVSLPFSDGTNTCFDYSRGTRQFLISRLGALADSVWRLSLDNPEQCEKIASLPRAHDKTWSDASWIGDTGFASSIPSKVPSGFAIFDRSSARPEVFFHGKSIQYFAASPDGQRLYIAGDLTNQPGCSIWEFEVATKALRLLVAASDKPLHHARHIQPRFTSVQLPVASGSVSLVIYPPADYKFGRRKKYPVVVTSIGFAAAQPYISQYAEAVANGGAYFIVVDRSWNFRGEGIANWEKTMDSFYTYLCEHTGERRLMADRANDPASTDPIEMPRIDKNRIFLLSNSAQSVGLAHLLDQHPGACKGAILLVPQMPKPSELHAGLKTFKVLISHQDGKEDALKKYQEEAWKEGVVVDYLVHPGAPHEFIAKRSQRERLRAMLRFIFN